MIGHSRAAFLSFALAGAAAVSPAFSQVGTSQPTDRTSAYYDFAMAHLYGELAGAYGNRGEYVNKAIDFYLQAMKADPSASYIAEELTDFYIQAGQLEKALQQAEKLLQENPNNNNARKILARIYTRQIGDPEKGKIDQAVLKKAIAEYEKITTQDPKDQESLSMLARLYRISPDAAAAERTYQQVLKLDPNDEDALNGLAMVYVDRGDLPNAISTLKQAIDKNGDPRSILTLAELYEQAKDYSRAADAMKQALALTNDNVDVKRRLAAYLYAAERYDEALPVFQELATGDPKNIQLQLQIAELLERKHDFSGAGAALAKARGVENSVDVRFAEEELLRIQGKTQQATAALQALLNETRKDQYSDNERELRLKMLDRLGNMQQDAGRTQEAVTAFRQIGELYPAFASRADVQVVEAYKAGKDYKSARQEADSALKKFPSERLVVFEHALLLADLGQTDAALTELKALPDALKDRDVLMNIAQIQDKAKRFDDEKKTLDAADALSKSPQDKQGIESMRGAMYERQKNFDAAEKAFRNVLSTDPNNAGAMNYLGYMFADRGMRLEEAQQLITKALELDPGNGAYEDSLGWVYYRLNRLDQAANELQLAVDKIGKDPTVHDHLGDVYFKQGKIREAIQQWETSVSEWKVAIPGEQDPEELAKVVKKLEGARVRVAEKTR